jgi:hypothetical protein
VWWLPDQEFTLSLPFFDSQPALAAAAANAARPSIHTRWMVRCALLVAMGLPLTAKSFATAPLELAPPPIAAGRRVSVWWKPHSATGLEAEVGSIVSDLAATDVLVYCGYAALPNGSFGVSPNATQQTWGNVTLCEAAVRQAAAAGLHARIMVEGRATLGFEAAVARGGARFGAEIAAIFGPKPFGSGLQGFNFDFEHKAGTHGAVGVSAEQYARFLREVSGSLPPGLDVTVAAATGWPFMSNFSRLLSPGPVGGNATALLDMALYHGANATQWAAQLAAAHANAAAEGAVVTRPFAYGAGLDLRAGASDWEGTPASVADRFDALERLGVRSVGVFEFTHGGLPTELTPAMAAAWAAALHAFAGR